jgi:hypothetical protein
MAAMRLVQCSINRLLRPTKSHSRWLKMTVDQVFTRPGDSVAAGSVADG